jgi:hypothetical protein
MLIYAFFFLKKVIRYGGLSCAGKPRIRETSVGSPSCRRQVRKLIKRACCFEEEGGYRKCLNILPANNMKAMSCLQII